MLARNSRKAHVVLLALLVLGAALWLGAREIYFSRWMDDDAYISFRYARNLARGHGLTFNPGERVEGYTNFLWTVLLSALFKLGADIPRTAQILGSLFSFLTLPVVFVLGRRSVLAATGVRRPGLDLLAIFPVLVLCLSETWAAWAVSGLENTLSAFLVAVAFLFYFDPRPLLPAAAHSDAEAPRRAAPGSARERMLLSAGFFALAALNHPSNALFAGATALHLLASARRDRERRAAVACFAGLFAAVYGGYFVGRAVYFGSLLPNTFYAKVGLTPWAWLRGARYLLDILMAYPLLFLAGAALPFPLRRRRLPNAAAWLVAASVLLYSLYLVGVGGEAFPAFRSLVVLLPLLGLLAQATLALLPQALARRPLAGAGALVLFLAANMLTSYTSGKVRALDVAVRLDKLGLYKTAALLLKAHLPANTLFAYGGAGVLAYYTEFPFIDTLGLTDAHIGRSRSQEMGKGYAGHEKGDGRYVFECRPDFIMFDGFPISSRKPERKTDLELVAIPGFFREYEGVDIPFEFRPAGKGAPERHDLYLYRRVAPPHP